MPAPDQRSVFLNVPFDSRYEPLFVTLVGCLVFLGQTPRCVLEVTETGQGRLQRIFDLLSGCRMSFHDLSRAGTPVRFNMPFELGLACALRLMPGRSHEIVVLDSKPYRLDRTLSDYKGRDPLVHGNRCDEIVAAIADVFQPTSLPPLPDLRSGSRLLRKTTRELKRRMKTSTVFRANAFKSLVVAATEIGVERGFIAP